MDSGVRVWREGLSTVSVTREVTDVSNSNVEVAESSAKFGYKRN